MSNIKVKHLLSAVAFAGEWALAFAVAKRLANAVDDYADAFAELADAFADAKSRICTLEFAHGLRWSETDRCHYATELSQAEPSGAELCQDEHS